jgi:hypothetical protein
MHNHTKCVSNIEKLSKKNDRMETLRITENTHKRWVYRSPLISVSFMVFRWLSNFPARGRERGGYCLPLSGAAGCHGPRAGACPVGGHTRPNTHIAFSRHPFSFQSSQTGVRTVWLTGWPVLCSKQPEQAGTSLTTVNWESNGPNSNILSYLKENKILPPPKIINKNYKGVLTAKVYH